MYAVVIVESDQTDGESLVDDWRRENGHESDLHHEAGEHYWLVALTNDLLGMQWHLQDHQHDQGVVDNNSAVVVLFVVKFALLFG